MNANAERTSSPFTLTRRFAAPRELVFDALTRKEHLMQWMSPPGCTMPRCTVDLRVGGVFHYGMQLPNGAVMWGQWIFREITSPNRLVVVVHFSDENGGVTRHPMAANWPLTTLSTTTLEDDGDGTVMHLQWQALNANDEEEGVFNSGHDSMRQGWGGTMTVLDAYLARMKATVSLDTPAQIVTTRELAFTPEQVWEVMTKPAHAAAWWGPKGFSTTTLEMDMRVGGLWRHTMRGPDGKEWPNRLKYTEVGPPHLLAWFHDDDGKGEISFRCRVELQPLPGGRTLLTMVHLFDSTEQRDEVIRISGAIQGAIEHTGRLVTYLQGLSA